MGQQIILRRLYCGISEKFVLSEKISLHVTMFNETDLRVFCGDRYIALYCTGLAESGGLMCGAFVVITN